MILTGKSKTHWWSEGRDVSIICGFRAKTICAQRLVGWRF